MKKISKVAGYSKRVVEGLPITKNVLAHTKTECAEKLEKLKEEYRPPSTRCKPDRIKFAASIPLELPQGVVVTEGLLTDHIELIMSTNP